MGDKSRLGKLPIHRQQQSNDHVEQDVLGMRGLKERWDRAKKRERGKIAVMRHPDHIGAADVTELWSHHEKV